MNLGTHMPDGERRKPIEVYRSKVKVLKHSHKRDSNKTQAHTNKRNRLTNKKL